MINITKLTEPGSLRAWLQNTHASGQTHVALDIETTGLSRTDKIISAAVTGPTSEDVAFFGPEMLHELGTVPLGLRFVLHNASFDLRFIAWAGLALHHTHDYSDTLILAHLLDENSSHSLGDLVKEHWNDDYKTQFWAKYKKAEDAPEEELAEYNAKDVSYTRRLYDLLRTALVQDGLPDQLIEHVHSLQHSLLETEIAGIAVDRDYLMQKGLELKTRIEELRPVLREMAGSALDLIECELWVKDIERLKTPKARAKVPRPEFNFASPTQLQKLFYEHLKLPIQYSTPKKNRKTGNYSKKAPTVDDAALKELQHLHPICEQLRYYRAFDKAYGTYVEGMLPKIVDGRIYPSFNVAGTVTGRISHSDPNMGNLPSLKKSKELDEPFLAGVRGMFIPDEGCVMISADFAQLEVCLSAHFTHDKNLMRIINEGVSQHDITAEGLSIPRALAKTVNFGMQYGCSHKKVAKVLKVNEEEGKKAYDKYWETYSGQKRVMDECASKVDRGEPIVSPFGRRRRFEVRRRQSWDSAYRQAWNALVQGTGSDCTSRAFYLTDEHLRKSGIGRSLFTVHDEIVIQAKEEHAEEAEKILVDTMAQVGVELGLTVPLKAEGSGGMERWLD